MKKLASKSQQRRVTIQRPPVQYPNAPERVVICLTCGCMNNSAGLDCRKLSCRCHVALTPPRRKE
jgi:hypothetical protein